MRILGVDPGSRRTGYGCVEFLAGKLRYIEHGTLFVMQKEKALEDRLYAIYTELTKIIEKLRPEVMAIEKVFFAKSALSSLKLGQAQAAAIVAGKAASLSVAQYSPTEVKKVVGGYGQIAKDRVFYMVKLLLSEPVLQEGLDASDALALAICHAYAARLQLGLSKKKQSISEALAHKAVKS